MPQTKSEATIIHPRVKDCPILTEGDVTPYTFIQLKFAHWDFFSERDIQDVDKVKQVLPGFRDKKIRMWIRARRSYLYTLSYEAFMYEFSRHYLPSSWETRTRVEMSRMRMEKNETFSSFCRRVRTHNIILRDTTSHLDDTRLRHQLEAGFNKDLFEYYCDEGISDITNLKDWIKTVERADGRLRNERQRFQKIAQEYNSGK
ncbi:hypothetical protein D9613_004203 [Agrocybe pediades]|uniref:Uncharacterized protein n=1 Tax=Agrocybe pediades TaxID=84607 RepID=A0A8H4QIS2_9AGAR|nr:hypothetical protein D9613_004203 [Agrocybe pediades]